MSNVIDLSTMVKEDLVFKLPNGDIFTIPGQVPVDFVLSLSKRQVDLQTAETMEEQFNILQLIVLDILKLDTERDNSINLDYVKANLGDVTLLKVIMEEMVKHIANLIDDENL